MMKERLIRFYNRSRILAAVWGISAVLTLIFIISMGMQQNWFFIIIAATAIIIPGFLRNYFVEYYHITEIFIKTSLPLIFIAILSIPFIFGSLSHIPFLLRGFAVLYFILCQSVYFWTATDPRLSK
ncbi:MAG: hypothetical protein ACRCUT_04685 [Spirochaetota bacterium]